MESNKPQLSNQSNHGTNSVRLSTGRSMKHEAYFLTPSTLANQSSIA